MKDRCETGEKHRHIGEGHVKDRKMTGEGQVKDGYKGDKKDISGRNE